MQMNIALISLLFLFPKLGLLKDSNGKNEKPSCDVEIVESLPSVLTFPNGSITLKTTFQAWKSILEEDKLDHDNQDMQIASFYWTMRSVDVDPYDKHYDNASEGELIFARLLKIAKENREEPSLTIVNSYSDSATFSIDDTELLKLKGADVRYLDMPSLLGGGVLHTKLIMNKHNKDIYVGSANMDWRALTLIKEIGLHFKNCSIVYDDLVKIFESYYMLALPNSTIPKKWPKEMATKYNKENPLHIKLSGVPSSLYFSVSPPPFLAHGRTDDLDALLDVIDKAEKYIYVTMMSFMPAVMFDKTTGFRYWPIINDKLLHRGIDDKIEIKLLISLWKYTAWEQLVFLQSLNDTAPISNIQIRLFTFPPPKGPYIDHTLVDHEKYMVTDNCAYIGTNNWTGDYFEKTAGIGTIINQTDAVLNNPQLRNNTIQHQLHELFMRDWNSKYALKMSDINKSSMTKLIDRMQ